MSSLRFYQEEFKRLVFFSRQAQEHSSLWPQALPDRLRVYRNNSRSNWTETLDCNFPLTRGQFGLSYWEDLQQRYFVENPPAHWELNTSVNLFPDFLKKQKIHLAIKELADYEWFDLKIYMDRARVLKNSGQTNLTAVLRVYQHSILQWAQQEAPAQDIPAQKPQVLVFWRDSQHICRIQQADPLMILMMEHFRQKDVDWADLEKQRQQLLPGNTVELQTVLDQLVEQDLILG